MGELHHDRLKYGFALFFSWSVYRCQVDKGWTVKGLKCVNLAKPNCISHNYLFCMLQVRVDHHKTKIWDETVAMFYSWKNDIVRHHVVDHTLLLPLVDNGSGQAHSSSIQGHIPLASLISGPSSRGTLRQELHFSSKFLGLIIDKFWHRVQWKKGRCRFHFLCVLQFFSTFLEFIFILPSWPCVL